MCKREHGDKDPNEWDYGVACYESAFKAFKSLMEDGRELIFTGLVQHAIFILVKEFVIHEN